MLLLTLQIHDPQKFSILSPRLSNFCSFYCSRFFGGVKERYSLKGFIAMVESTHVTPSHCLKSIINNSNYFTYRFICNLQSVNVLEFQQTGLTHCSRMLLGCRLTPALRGISTSTSTSPWITVTTLRRGLLFGTLSPHQVVVLFRDHPFPLPSSQLYFLCLNKFKIL